MKNLMEWHFNVQKGMYFDRKIEVDNCCVFLSDIIDDGFWNYAYAPACSDINHSLENLEKTFHAANRQPCIYLADKDKQSQAVELLCDKGFNFLTEESFMTYTRKQSITAKITSLLTKRVIDETIQKDFIDVFTNAYGGEKTPEQPYGELDKTYMEALIRSFDNLGQFYHFVCYEGSTPVSIASLCYVDGKGGLYNVGTTPVSRGKGFGTVATKACIDKWIELNGDTLFLQTETGSNVESWYYKLGFKLEFVGSTYCKE